jgi:hypothetical protein
MPSAMGERQILPRHTKEYFFHVSKTGCVFFREAKYNKESLPYLFFLHKKILTAAFSCGQDLHCIDLLILYPKTDTCSQSVEQRFP